MLRYNSTAFAATRPNICDTNLRYFSQLGTLRGIYELNYDHFLATLPEDDFRGMVIVGRFFATLYKRKNFCYLLFGFLHTKESKLYPF